MIVRRSDHSKQQRLGKEVEKILHTAPHRTGRSATAVPLLKVEEGGRQKMEHGKEHNIRTI